MFEAVRYVAGWFSLAAFLAAVFGTALRHYWTHKRKLLEAVPKGERASYALAVLDKFSLRTEDLSPDQRFRLARDLLKQRADRFDRLLRLLRAFLVAAIILFIIAYFLPRLLGNGQPTIEELLEALDVSHPGQQKSVDLLEQWSRRHTDFLETRGQPLTVKFVDVWSQTFANGRILYNSTDSWLVVLFGDSSTYLRYSKPAATITSGPGNREINEELLNTLLSRLEKPDVRAEYRDLVNRRKLMGGIGTVYIRENLRPRIGVPLASEFSRADALFVAGPRYEMLVGLRNDKSSKDENDIYVFDLSSDRFEKHSFFSWRWKPRTSV